MNELPTKQEYLQWLKSVGIEYYSSEKKDSKILITKNSIKSKNTPNCEKSPNFLEKESGEQKIINDYHKEVEEQMLDPIRHARILADNSNTLDELKQKIENFNGCQLKGFATNTVFADGNPNAKILALGEAPGATEDQKGIPFCGVSGLLLDKMFASINLSREKNIYITNSVFWRPPANRRPTENEIEICKPFVEKHIAIIKPKLIILVGSTAITALLGKNISLSNARSKNYSYTNQYLSESIQTKSIFHPAYLLRQPGQKKTAWYDLLKIQNCLYSHLQ